MADQSQVLMKICTIGEIRSLIDTEEVALEFMHQLAPIRSGTSYTS